MHGARTTMVRPQVSSLGRFRNVHGVVTFPAAARNGYVSVRIHKKNYGIHRLIAMAFNLPHVDGQSSVDHIDGNPSNNRVDNLRWASAREQINYSYTNNLGRKSSAMKQSKPVRGRKLGTTSWTTFLSSCDAARCLELDPRHIAHCLKKRQKQTGGYEFAYAEPNECDTLPNEEWKDVLLE